VGHCARNVEAFSKKIATVYHQNLTFLLEFGLYAIAVFFKKNTSTLRVHSLGYCVCVQMYVWPRPVGYD